MLGTRGTLWEVFLWLSIMANQIDKALLTMPDELALEPSYFKEPQTQERKTQLLLGNYEVRHSLLLRGCRFTSKFRTCMVPKALQKVHVLDCRCGEWNGRPL